MNAITPPDIITEVKKIASAFLWEGKKPKVAYSTLIMPIQDGGLKLLDLESRIKTNHLIWVKRIINNPDGSSAQFIRGMTGVDNLAVIFGAKRIAKPKYITPVSQFYAQMMRTWTMAHDFPPENEQEVREEVIWDNKQISSPKAMLQSESWRQWLEAGIVNVHQLCHQTEDRMLGHQEISSKFGIKCNFLEALRIRNSIPYNWRTSLTRNYPEDVGVTYNMQINNTRFDLLSSNPRQWYTEEVRSRGHPFNRAEAWRKELGIGERDQSPDWGEIFTSPYRTSRETKMHSFAYKLEYRIIPCNEFLNKIKIKESPICTFCESRDTISHFFYECPTVTPLWSSLEQWCAQHLDLAMSNLSMAEVLLGVHRPIRQQKLTNWLLLHLKFYIHKKKLFFGAEVALHEFLAECRLKLLTERRACACENRMGKFKCWERMLQVLG